MELCNEIGALYIDTVNEPWPGFYFDSKLAAGGALELRAARSHLDGQARAASPAAPRRCRCCGANPGMVSWFVKQALLDVARDTGLKVKEPATREEWGRLMQQVLASRASISPSATPSAPSSPSRGRCSSTPGRSRVSVSEGMQPAELGWGTHEKWMPGTATSTRLGRGAAIYLTQPGANTRVRSWTPDRPGAIRLPGHPQRVDLDRRLLHAARRRHGGLPADLPLRLSSLQRRRAVAARDVRPGRDAADDMDHILDEHEIVDGIDELGVLLYGHEKNAYWYGSQLSIEETRRIAPYQNATGLQVTSAVLAGMVWALENPTAGIVEADEMDFRRCLEVQTALSRPGDRRLHRLDAAHRTARAVRRGHRQARSLAVQERAGAVRGYRIDTGQIGRASISPGLAVLGAQAPACRRSASQPSAVTGASPGFLASTSAPSSIRTSSTVPSA